MCAQRVLAIVNPTAGGDPKELLGVLAAAEGVELEVLETRATGDGTTLAAAGAAEFDPEIVVAIGGDGTAGEVARGLCGIEDARQPALLVASGGTGNSSARGMWEDTPWEEIVSAVFVHRRRAIRRIDLIRLVELDMPVLLGISTGIIPECLIEAANLPLKGRQRLLNAALQAMSRYEPFPVRVLVDGEVLRFGEILLVTVGGSRYRGGIMEILPDSLLDDGLIDVCVIDASVTVDELAGAVMSNRLGELPGIHYGRGRSVRIERVDGAPMKLEHDGELELGARSEYEARVIPRAIPVVVADPPPSCVAAPHHHEGD